jgi:GntR family transcriptional regulator
MAQRARLPSLVPLYRQVKQILLDRIAGGAWQPGDLLPAEPRLGEELGVSPGTVRKALDELAAEQVVVRHQGRGTFVAAQTPDTALFRFFRLVTPAGERTVPSSRELARAAGPAEADECRRLGLPPGTPVLRVRRSRETTGGGRLVERIVVPLTLFPGLDASPGELPNTLYDLYERRYGKSVRRAAELLRAVALDAADGEALGLPAGAPALEIDRVAYSFNDLPVEWRRSLVDTRNLRYASELV